jgi:DnaJ-class molecular chaperone
VIGGEELREQIALKVENGKLKRELDEALRQLRKSTGCDWTKVIETRALPWIKRKTCETCKGLGEIPVDKWSAFCGHLPSRCEACKGEGEVYYGEPHDPNGPPCAGCPDVACSDYELCAKKRLGGV